MPSYRVYWLDEKDRIKRGDWIEADDDDDAHRRAVELCHDGDADKIQVWQSTRPVDEVDCP